MTNPAFRECLESPYNGLVNGHFSHEADGPKLPGTFHPELCRGNVGKGAADLAKQERVGSQSQYK